MTDSPNHLADRLKLIWDGLVDLWCGWTHGGGNIMRDPLDRVNWQCAKCGRWATPVPDAELESAAIRDS